MSGISPAGWFHTLASLPAIPLALYMFISHGRILPNSRAGAAYLVFMTIGAVSVYAIAKAPASYVIATLTLLTLAVGYGLARVTPRGRLLQVVETISLSTSTLLLMIPTVTETLTRLPDGGPVASSVDAPVVMAAQGAVLVIFLVGLAAQLVSLSRRAA